MKTLPLGTALGLAALLLGPAASRTEGEDANPSVRPFRLNDHQGRVRSFGPASWEGYTVFAFFPKARTPG